MTLNVRYLQLPRQGRGSPLLLRFTILILDFTAFICLCVDLGLYQRWVTKTKDILTDLLQGHYIGSEVYSQIIGAFSAIPYWEDPVVIDIVLFSLTCTAFIYLRPAWARKPLHLGANLVFELLLSFIILACSIPAFVFSPLQRPNSLSFYEKIGEYYTSCYPYAVGSAHYQTEHALPSRGLQVAAYALVWAVTYVPLSCSCYQD